MTAQPRAPDSLGAMFYTMTNIRYIRRKIGTHPPRKPGDGTGMLSDDHKHALRQG